MLGNLKGINGKNDNNSNNSRNNNLGINKIYKEQLKNVENELDRIRQYLNNFKDISDYDINNFKKLNNLMPSSSLFTQNLKGSKEIVTNQLKCFINNVTKYKESNDSNEEVELKLINDFGVLFKNMLNDYTCNWNDNTKLIKTFYKIPNIDDFNDFNDSNDAIFVRTLISNGLIIPDDLYCNDENVSNIFIHSILYKGDFIFKNDLSKLFAYLFIDIGRFKIIISNLFEKEFRIYDVKINNLDDNSVSKVSCIQSGKNTCTSNASISNQIEYDIKDILINRKFSYFYKEFEKKKGFGFVLQSDKKKKMDKNFLIKKYAKTFLNRKFKDYNDKELDDLVNNEIKLRNSDSKDKRYINDKKWLQIEEKIKSKIKEPINGLKKQSRIDNYIGIKKVNKTIEIDKDEQKNINELKENEFCEVIAYLYDSLLKTMEKIYLYIKIENENCYVYICPIKSEENICFLRVNPIKQMIYSN